MGYESKGVNIPTARFQQLSELAVSGMLGFGMLDPAISDDKLEDIMVTDMRKLGHVYRRKIRDVLH